MKFLTLASSFLFLFSFSSPSLAKERGVSISSFQCRYVLGEYQVWAIGTSVGNSEEHWLHPVSRKMGSKEQCERIARNTPVPK